MAWPIDARDVTYAPLQQVTSANLNQIQNKIVDVFSEKKMPVFEATIHHLAAGDPRWQAAVAPDTGFEFGHTLANVTGLAAADFLGILYHLRLPDSCKLKRVDIKADFSTGGADFRLYRIDSFFSTSGTAPTKTLVNSVAHLAAGGWAVNSISLGAGEVLTRGQHFVLAPYGDGTTLAAVGSLIAAVEFQYEPIVPVFS